MLVEVCYFFQLFDIFESSPFLGSCNFFEKLLFNYQFYW